MSYRNKNTLGLGQPGYAAERYIPTNLGQANYAAERYVPVSLGQPGYAAERYIPMSGLGQAKGGDSTAKGGDSTAKGGSGPDNTARDVRMAADIGGSLVRGFIGAPATPPPVAETTAMVEPPPSSGSDLYWPLVIGGGLILVGGIGYFALKGKKSAPTANKRKRGSKRVSKNGYGRSRYGSSYSGDPRWMAAKYAGIDSEGKSFKKGDEILYWPSTKTVMTGAKAKQAWLDFLSAKGDEEGMPFARNSRQRVSRNAGGTFALVRAEGMNDRVISLHKTQEAAEKAMEKKGGIPRSLFTQGMRVVDVGPNGFDELIEIFGQKTIRPRAGSRKKLAPNRKRVSRR